MTSNEIKKIIDIDASTKVVFKALTNIEDLTQWFPDQGTIEPKIGGKMHFRFLPNQKMDKEGSLDGEILEYIPDKKFSYTFIPGRGCISDMPSDGKIKPTIVTWELEELGKNKTRVTLTHSGFDKEMDEIFKQTTAGWNYFAGRLVTYCQNKRGN